MKISSLKPGDVVFTVSRHKAGNTTLKTVSVHKVKVLEVHEGYVLASWNGNPPLRYHSFAVSSWRKKEPVTVRTGFGTARLATQEEIRKLKEEEKEKDLEFSPHVIILPSYTPVAVCLTKGIAEKMAKSAYGDEGKYSIRVATKQDVKLLME